MEKLLTITQAAKSMAISRTQFYRILPHLKAQGLQVVQIYEGGQPKVVASSLDKLIQKSMRRESPIIAGPAPLVSIGPSGIGGPYQKEIYAD